MGLGGVISGFKGIPGVTYEVATGDTVSTIESAKLTSNGARAKYANITVEDNAIRYAFNVDPDRSGVGVDVSAGASIELFSFDEIKNIRFTNAGVGSNGSLQITIYYL